MGEIDIETLTMEQTKDEDAYEHVEKVLEITSAVKRYTRRVPTETVNNYELLKRVFILRYCPPSRTVEQLKDIRLEVPTCQMLDFHGSTPGMTTTRALVRIVKKTDKHDKCPRPAPIIGTFAKKVKKRITEEQEKTFLESLEKIPINTPLIDTLSCLTEQASTKGEGSMEFHSSLHNRYMTMSNALADLGASISVIPFYLFKRLGLVNDEIKGDLGDFLELDDLFLINSVKTFRVLSDTESEMGIGLEDFSGNLEDLLDEQASQFGQNEPQFPLNYESEPGYIENYNSYPYDSSSFPQQYPCCEDCGGLPEADHCQPPQYTVNHSIFNAHNDLLNSQNKLIEQITSMCEMVACCDDDDDYNFAITLIEPVDSLSMGDEHLNTISAKESDEFIKSCVENLVLNPSESKGENGCDVPACFTTFSNILFDADYDFYSVNDQSLSDEYFLKEIYSNPLFDEEIISMKIDPHHFNAESDLIESMLNRDSLIISSSKIDSLFDEFASELALLKSISARISETDCDPENEIRLTKRLLYDNSSPRPPKEFVSENSNAEIKSFSPSPIPVKDSDSLIEEINISFTPDDPMLPGIEEDDDDSERDILILEELLDNYSLSLPENESFRFDIPSFSHPPAKPPDGNT
nr:hypothetical protein [Tanacetum cinerariifolium]